MADNGQIGVLIDHQAALQEQVERLELAMGTQILAIIALAVLVGIVYVRTRAQ